MFKNDRKKEIDIYVCNKDVFMYTDNKKIIDQL